MYIPFRRNIYSVLFSTAVGICKCELFLLSVCLSVCLAFPLGFVFRMLWTERKTGWAYRLHTYIFICCSVRRVKFHWLHRGFHSGFREIWMPWKKWSVLRRAVLRNASVHNVTWIETNLNQHKSNSSVLYIAVKWALVSLYILGDQGSNPVPDWEIQGTSLVFLIPPPISVVE